MTRHVSADTLADFRQGDLSPRKSSRISAHLAGCDRCRTLDGDLAGVRTLLAGAQPPPIPEHLAARIQTALATEAASRATRTAGSENGIRAAAAGNAGTAGGAGHDRPWRLPHLPHLGSRVVLGSVAAVAAVLVVLGGVYEMTVPRGVRSAPSGTAAAAPSSHAAAQSPSNGLAAPGPSGAAAMPVLQYRHAGHQDSVTPVTTDTDFTPNQLDSQVSAAVASYGAGMSKAVPATNPLAGMSSTQGPAKQPATFGNIPMAMLQGCVNRMAAQQLVLLVDVARYRGTPATVIVTEVAVLGPQQIWVVGMGCSGSRGDVITHVTMTAP
jgi:hypothetical protein